MFRFFYKFLSPNQTSIKHLHVHSVESIKTTRGHELDRMTEEFKMFGTFPMYWSISRFAFHLCDSERPDKSCAG